MDGQQVLKNIREKSNVPVIVLSAKDELDTKVDLLMSGASDYMTKPFELKELEARVLVQLRNAAGKNEVFLEYRDLRIDREGKKVILCGKPLVPYGTGIPDSGTAVKTSAESIYEK